MAMTRSLIAVLAATTTLAMVSACSGSKSDPTPSPSSTPTTSSAPTTPATTTPPPTPTDLAKRQALAIVTQYVAALNKVGLDPAVPLNSLYNVAAEPEVLTELSSFGNSRALGYRQSGEIKLVKSTVTAVDLAVKPPSTRATVHVAACLDVSAVRVTDSKGRNVVVAGRPNFFIDQMTIINLAGTSAGGWRVGTVTDKGAQSCASL